MGGSVKTGESVLIGKRVKRVNKKYMNTNSGGIRKAERGHSAQSKEGKNPLLGTQDPWTEGNYTNISNT